MKWVTRERPKIDRIACPWLIARFIDKEPEFLYVPAATVLQVAQDTGAIPYDVPGVEMTHDGDFCSFDAFLKKYGLTDPALQELAVIVRGADTSRLDLAPQSAGLYALSLGLSKTFNDDHEMLMHGMVMYDALYAWCQSCQAETHHWPPEHGGMKQAIAWRPRRFTRGLYAHFLCGVLMPFVCAASPESKLTTAQIRSTVGGHHVSDGRHWGHDYFLDGRLERSENGRTRSGRWTAQNNQLCLLLPEVSKESPVCFDVVRVGDELQYRDAGRVVYAGAVKKRTTRLQEGRL